MNEMIERVALAIRETLIAKGVDAANPFGEMISQCCARAAITAMRDKEVWRAMIDAALAE